MKKIISILLCAILCIPIFCACSRDNTDIPDSSDAGIETPSADISYDEVSYIIPGENTSSVVESSQTDNSSELSESGTDETSEIPSDNSEDINSSNDNNQSSETSLPPNQQTGGLLVKMVKYDYDNTFEQENTPSNIHRGQKGNVSIAIIDITNETDKHYSVTINGKYLDKNGNVLKTETQEWNQFKAGWQKYFLFRPGITFDKFEYTIETAEYTGDCWKCGYINEFEKLTLMEREFHPKSSTASPIFTQAIGLWSYRGIDTPFAITHGETFFVLLDASNQVIGIYQHYMDDIGEEPYKAHSDCIFNVYFPDINGDGKIKEWPDRLKNVKCISIITWVEKA